MQQLQQTRLKGSHLVGGHALEQAMHAAEDYGHLVFDGPIEEAIAFYEGDEEAKEAVDAAEEAKEAAAAARPEPQQPAPPAANQPSEQEVG